MSKMSLERTIIASIAVIVIILLGTFPAIASDSASHKIVVNVPVILEMSVTSQGRTSSGEEVVTRYDVPEPTDHELKQGYVENEDAATLAVTANVDWKVTIRSEDRFMGTSEDGAYRKPASDLMVRSSESSFGYQSVITSPKTIVEGELGTFNLGLDYKTKLNKSKYQKGSYEATLIYTISSRA